MDTKVCRRKTCWNNGLPQPIENFSKNRKMKDGYNTWCKQCKDEYLKNYYRTNEEYRIRQRERRLEREYGLANGEYARMLEKQDGICAICRKKETSGKGGNVNLMSIDHNHATNRIRELLCHRCNTMIGLSGENQEILRRAANYLEKWSLQNPS